MENTKEENVFHFVVGGIKFHGEKDLLLRTLASSRTSSDGCKARQDGSQVAFRTFDKKIEVKNIKAAFKKFETGKDSITVEKILAPDYRRRFKSRWKDVSIKYEF